MPPPRVYMSVSRSGQTRRPKRVVSSAVLPITVISAGSSPPGPYVGSPARSSRRPRRKRAPPIPPASAVIRTRPSSQPVSGDGRRDAQLEAAAAIDVVHRDRTSVGLGDPPHDGQ